MLENTEQNTNEKHATKTKHNSEQESCAIAKMTARCALYK